jgi:hypothetical protein
MSKLESNSLLETAHTHGFVSTIPIYLFTGVRTSHALQNSVSHLNAECEKSNEMSEISNHVYAI